jgi:hypothetical protein
VIANKADAIFDMTCDALIAVLPDSIVLKNFTLPVETLSVYDNVVAKLDLLGRTDCGEDFFVRIFS